MTDNIREESPKLADKKMRRKSLTPTKDDFVFYYKTNIKHVRALTDNFSKRNWQFRHLHEDEWHLFWSTASVGSKLFTESGRPMSRFRDNQIVNHFPKSIELARKDSFAQHIQRYREKLARDESPVAVTSSEMSQKYYELGGTRFEYLNFLPLTFVLPKEINEAKKAFKSQPKAAWIIKPVGGSEGQGIRVISSSYNLEELRGQATTSNLRHDTKFVLSRYIEDPYLIHGKKFDIRFYVLLTSMEPLKAYLYNEAFCRLSSRYYKLDPTTYSDTLMHLTNSKVQGCMGEKMSFNSFFEYLGTKKPLRREEAIMQEIEEIIVHSLLSVKGTLINDPHCFELYGYDILLDSQLKPWLIEINSAPNLFETSDSDREMKTRLVDNVLNMVLPPSGIPDVHWNKIPTTEAADKFTELTEESVSIDALSERTFSEQTDLSSLLRF